MKQYCRYCINANIIDDDQFYCHPQNMVFNANKSKRVNRCKDFEFCENDLWRQDEYGNFTTYQPRQQVQSKSKSMGQITFNEVMPGVQA